MEFGSSQGEGEWLGRREGLPKALQLSHIHGHTVWFNFCNEPKGQLRGLKQDFKNTAGGKKSPEANDGPGKPT